MRILLLNVQLYPDFIGGVEKRNHDLAIELASRGHHVTLVGFGRGPSENVPGVEVRSLGPLAADIYGASGRRKTSHAFWFAWLAFRLDLSPYDVVEVSNIPYVHLIPLTLRCTLLRKPLLVTWYEFWGPYWKKYVGASAAPFYRATEWLTAQLGTSVVAASRLTAGRLQRRRLFGRGRPVSSVPIVSCGIHLNEIQAAGRAIPKERATIIFAGRLIREKRIDLLLHAFAALPRERGARLVVFGDGPERERLAALSNSLDLTGRVELRGHHQDAEEIWRCIAAARIAVQPSSREGFGIFPLEAMALGVPVVYCDSDDSAVSELVRDGEEGLRAPATAEGVCAALDRLLLDDALSSRLGRSGAVRALSYDVERMGQQMEALLQELADMPATSQRSQRSHRSDRPARPAEPPSAP